MGNNDAVEPRVGVVFASWQVPEHRLADHFCWNWLLYRKSGAMVFAVTDREYYVPDYAECVILPEGALPVIRAIRRFSLTRAKNAGLQAAIAAGCDPIICTDVDMVLEPEAWKAAIEVTEGTAAVPIYRMSHSDQWDMREHAYDIAVKATGTVTMTAANWQRIHFCDEQWGYGCDDGLIVERIHAATPHIDVERIGHVYHMAHDPGSPQVEFDKKNPRTDHWNRASGLNPENFARNGRLGHVKKKRRI